jgi:cysteine desulfurase / selenocysteine lyase
MNKDDFPLLKKGIIYFDNAATTLKPYSVILKTTEYYSEYSANAHRGDYDMSLKVDNEFEETRVLVKEFINASKTSEIIFTSGSTDSINKLVLGYFKNYLSSSDEVLTTYTEHASLVLPFYELDCKLSFINLVNNKVTLDEVKKSINNNTKVIVLAHITNVIGDLRPIKEIIKYAHERGILVVIDAAQSAPHIKIDVQDLDVDFMFFSAHKMLGPTGVGVLYGKEELLLKVKPIMFGGGMNISFNKYGEKEYNSLPHLLEAGTPNIAGVIAFKEAIKYLNNLGLSNIHNYELELTNYLKEQLSLLEDIIIYNKETDSSIISFNHKDIFSQDLAIYLNKHKICVRAGNHCAKMINEVLPLKNSCRISLYFYNTKQEIDILINALKNKHIKEEII